MINDLSQGFVGAPLTIPWVQKFIQSSVIDVYPLKVWWNMFEIHFGNLSSSEFSTTPCHTIRAPCNQLPHSICVRPAWQKGKLLIYSILSISHWYPSGYVVVSFVKLMNLCVHRFQAEPTQWRNTLRTQNQPKVKYYSSNFLWISFILFCISRVCFFLLRTTALSSFVKYRIKRSVFNASF